MKVCVVGAGAIGGYLGVRIARQGHEVSLIARGPHLAAIKEKGLTLRQGGEEACVRDVFATDDMTECGPQDVVLLTLKSHQIVPVVDPLKTLLGPETVMIALQNGIPWWYFQGNGGEYENRIVETVDPGGILANSIDSKCIIGCIAYPAATIAEPGVIQHIEGDRFPVGELDNGESDRLNMVSELFIEAGFKSRLLTDIRSEIWLKLWGNLTFNPISALTHSTLVDICQYPKTRELATTMMTEAQAIAERLGASLRVTIERRIDGAESVGKHKTSMLQDVEAGKPLEIDGMLGVVIELGEMTGVETPALKALYACASLLNKKIQDDSVYIKECPLGQ
ncbi:MAG: 2-dehydropantoate 2-reductase [Gammaproteobacteria bacterium]|nr:2-dehydropantoate 2-reductase [Gammaproteobacteria bacterium]